jgi:hypothetical protein
MGDKIEIGEFQRKIMEKDDENLYKSCCAGTSDKRLLKFIIQSTISLSIMGFSMYMLSSGVECSEQSIYVGILTSIFSIWLPSPKF